MNHDLLSREERVRGLRPAAWGQRPYIIYSYLWRRRPRAVSHEDWQETLSLREARLLGLGVVLLALASVGVVWLFSLLGWIR